MNVESWTATTGIEKKDALATDDMDDHEEGEMSQPNASKAMLQRKVTDLEAAGHHYADWPYKRALPKTLKQLCKWWRLKPIGKKRSVK